MYRKEEIVLISSSVTYLRFVLANTNVTVFTYDQILRTDILPLARINTLSVSLFNNQYAIDEDHSAIFISPSIIGQYVRIIYYTNGTQNPFYASSNLHNFINQVLRWTSNRIVDGLFLYWDDAASDINEKNIRPGSFVYETQFYTYQGGTFNVRDYSPPMVMQTYKSYLLVINSDIISSYLDVQGRMLTRIGVVTSTTAHETATESKADVDSTAASRYDSQLLKVAYVHAYLTDQRKIEEWVDYPAEYRTL
jgi:hypothetical protein